MWIGPIFSLIYLFLLDPSIPPIIFFKFEWIGNGCLLPNSHRSHISFLEVLLKSIFHFSGLTNDNDIPTTERGVTPVYLRCRTGRITWLYPKGALRVILRLPGNGRDFRACVKVRENKTKPAARLFLEGPRSLLKLYSHNDGSLNNIR